MGGARPWGKLEVLLRGIRAGQLRLLLWGMRAGLGGEGGCCCGALRGELGEA